MKYVTLGIMTLILLAGVAMGSEPIQLSGKNFSDFDLTKEGMPANDGGSGPTSVQLGVLKLSPSERKGFNSDNSSPVTYNLLGLQNKIAKMNTRVELLSMEDQVSTYINKNQQNNQSLNATAE